MTSPGDPQQTVGTRELRERVTYELLRAAAGLGVAVDLSLGDLRRLLQMAGFHVLRSAGYRVEEIAERLGISRRKAAQLSIQLKRNFLAASTEHTLPRKVEFVLWASPQSRARLGQALPAATSDELDEAIARLLEEGRVEERPGRVTTYARVRPKMRLVRDELLARIDGLGNLAANAADAIHARFFGDEERSFARTVSLHVRPEDFDELRRLYEDVLWPRLVALDEAAAETGADSAAVDLSIQWAPRQHIMEQLAAHRERVALRPGR